MNLKLASAQPVPLFSRRRFEKGTAVAMLAVAMLLVAFTITYLVAAVDEQDNAASSWTERLRSWRNRIFDAFPLTAIKIVVVAWQIITQV